MSKTPIILDLKANMSAQCVKSNNCDIDIHLHDSYEIFIAISDNIRYYIEGHTYDLQSGDIIITNPMEIHRPSTTNDQPYERMFIQFKTSVLSPIFEDGYNPLQIFDNRNLGHNNLIPAAKENDIILLTKEFTSLYNQNNSKSRLLMKAILLKLLVMLNDNYNLTYVNNKERKLLDSRIQTVIDDISKNYTKPLSLDTISKNHYMDKYYLSHLFKKQTGFTILEYIQSKRIQHAKVLITKGLGITTASKEAGFEDYSNFYKTFKKLMHMTPKEFMNQSKSMLQD